jgi:hypothetical protein
MTLGYSGSYDSGFPDEHAYEDWLFRLERLADDHERLTAGERVSGPAAATYAHRITGSPDHTAPSPVESSPTPATPTTCSPTHCYRSIPDEP